MSIRQKVILAAVATSFLTILAGWAAIRYLSLEGFERIDQERAFRDLAQAANALDSELVHMDASLRFKSSSDITYQYAGSRDKRLAANYFSWEALKGGGLNVMALFDPDGRVLAGGGFDLATREALPLNRLLDGIPDAIRRPTAGKPPGGRGLLMTPIGPMLLCYQPVLNSMGLGESRGTLLAGRLLDAALVEGIGARLRLDFSAVPLAEASPGLASRVKGASRDGTMTVLAPVFSQPDGHGITVHAAYPDLFGNPALMLTVQHPRTDILPFRKAMYLALVFVAVAGAFLFALNIALLRLAVLKPLELITRHIRGIKHTRDLGKDLPLHQKDEIGLLSGAFNAMGSDMARLYDQLDQAHQSIQHILDSMPSPVISVDGNARVTHMNAAAGRLAVFASGEAEGRPLGEVFPLLAGHTDAVGESLARGVPASEAKLKLVLLGEPRLVDLAVFPLSAGGQAGGAVIRLDDVTERLRMEEVMLQTEKVMSVGGLAAGMAHEINNPLGGILMNVQVIKRRLDHGLPANDRAAGELGCSIDGVRAYLEERGIPSFLDAIQDSGTRAARIVASFLEFSRRSESKMAPCDLAEIMDKAMELASNSYEAGKFDLRSVEVVREYQAGLPLVRCTKTEIEQVALNLVRNAAQAMSGTQPDKGHRMVLRLARDGDHALLEVEDNGPGMAEAVRKRVFEPFFTTKPPGLGTGLGLSVSYFIVTRNHGGTMEVRSEPGLGARFTVRLPVNPAEKLPSDIPSATH